MYSARPPRVAACFCWCDVQLLEKWFGVLGTSAQGAIKDLNLYQEQVGKIEQAELVGVLL